MLHRFSREELLIGAQGLEKLQRARVAVFGIGGVGGYVVEALARSGVGALDLFDGDTVALTNINRQIIALESTVGRPKVEVARERVLQINPACQVEARQLFFTPENAGEVDFSQYDYVADAIDTVSSKIELLRLCREAGVAPSKVFPHNLRHLFARCFYQACRDVAKLADVLGHSSIETTRIYLISTGAEHARTLDRLRLIS